MTVSGKGASSPDSCSCSTRNAWCGRFPLPLSLAVKLSFRVLAVPRVTGFARGDVWVNLQEKSVVRASPYSNAWDRTPGRCDDAYFSLVLSAAFLAAIWTLPSSNPQPEAACATPAASRSSAGAIDCVSRMMGGCRGLDLAWPRCEGRGRLLLDLTTTRARLRAVASETLDTCSAQAPCTAPCLPSTLCLAVLSLAGSTNAVPEAVSASRTGAHMLRRGIGR